MNQQLKTLAVKGVRSKMVHTAVSRGILSQLQYPSGLFGASKQGVSTGYNKSWIRDNVYEALGLEAVGDEKGVLRAFHALLDVMRKHEYKLDHAISEKPTHAYQYIHARFHPLTFDEFDEEWGNKQNDAIGAFLFKVGDLHRKGKAVIRSHHDIRVLQKLVGYLSSIEYWHDKDNGIWEENAEVHASSVGACVAGLRSVQHIVIVPQDIIVRGELALAKLLPRESETKDVDLALLSLIYTYKQLDFSQAMRVLHAVESRLVRARGVIRYENDAYYNEGGEAEWTMGFPWLAKIYKDLGDRRKFEHYLKKTQDVINANGELPELYFAGSRRHNENSPLGWAQSLYLVALNS